MEGMIRKEVTYLIKSMFGNNFKGGNRISSEGLVPHLPFELLIFHLPKYEDDIISSTSFLVFFFFHSIISYSLLLSIELSNTTLLISYFKKNLVI